MVTPMKVHGVDISHHQSGALDMAGAKRRGLEFIYHKATEGDSYRDDRYNERREQARKAGIPFGAYHFARPERGDAEAEARSFVAYAKPKPGDLSPCLDLETTEGLTLDQLRSWAATWCRTVEKLVPGSRVVLYTPFDLGEVEKGRARWRPRYNNSNTPPNLAWDIWQFSNGVYGVPNQLAGFGHVDLNTLRKGFTTASLLIKKAKPEKPQARITFGHASLQYSDTKKQQEADAEKLFARAEELGHAWLTGTEAGETQLYTIVREAAQRHGYRTHRMRGNWIAVANDVIKRGTWKTGDVWIMDNDEVVGHGHDPAFPWVSFEHKTPGVGEIHIAAVHYPTKGRVPSDPNHWVNKEYAKALGKWAREHGKGSRLAFVGGDFNMPDQKQIDLFFDEPFTTFGDFLKKWPNTGHGPIDALAKWDADGRVHIEFYRVLDDKRFFLNTDHFYIEGGVDVDLMAVA